MEAVVRRYDAAATDDDIVNEWAVGSRDADDASRLRGQRAGVGVFPNWRDEDEERTREIEAIRRNAGARLADRYLPGWSTKQGTVLTLAVLPACDAASGPS